MNPIPAQKDSSGTGCGGDLELIPGTAATGSVRRLQAMEQTTRYIRLPRVLIAGDDDDIRKLISVSLREAGYEITECRSAIGLMDYVGDWHAAEHIHDFSLVVSELPMPDMAVFELFEAMSPSRNLPPVILVVDVADNRTRAVARDVGISHIIQKPFALDDFLTTVRKLVPTPHA